MRRKVRRRFGGRLKAWVSGGAALNQEIGLFFLALGVPLLQGYGQTEASPVISANPPRRIKIATVGPALEGVEVKIAEDGEILVRSEAVMKGYWRDGGRDRGGDPRGLAPYRRYRQPRRRGLSEDHRPQEGHHRAVRRRQCLAGAGRGLPGAAARDQPGHGPWRPPSAYRGPARARCGVRRRLGRRARTPSRPSPSWPRTRLPPGPGRGGRPGQCRSLAHRAHPPLRHRARALHHRERHADGLAEDPPPQDPGTLRRACWSGSIRRNSRDTRRRSWECRPRCPSPADSPDPGS